jgi:hypothetical protein
VLRGNTRCDWTRKGLGHENEGLVAWQRINDKRGQLLVVELSVRGIGHEPSVQIRAKLPNKSAQQLARAVQARKYHDLGHARTGLQRRVNVDGSDRSIWLQQPSADLARTKRLAPAPTAADQHSLR